MFPCPAYASPGSAPSGRMRSPRRAAMHMDAVKKPAAAPANRHMTGIMMIAPFRFFPDTHAAMRTGRGMARYGPAYGRKKIRVRHGATVQASRDRNRARDAAGQPEHRRTPPACSPNPRFSSSRLRRQLSGEGFAGIPLDRDGKTHREHLLKPIADETETLASRIFAGRYTYRSHKDIVLQKARIVAPSSATIHLFLLSNRLLRRLLYR